MNKQLLNFIAEFLGTFIFLGTIVTVINSKESIMNFLKIGLALIVSISFFGGVSGGAFNPAVSLLLYLNNIVEYLYLEFFSAFIISYQIIYIKIKLKCT